MLGGMETKDVHTASGGTFETKSVPPGYRPAAVVNENSTARQRVEEGSSSESTEEATSTQESSEDSGSTKTTSKRGSSKSS